MGTHNSDGVGFRFQPSDEEIVSFFLRHKVAGRHHLTRNIAEIDFCQCEPWELPAIQSDDQVWYFFCRQDRKYSRGPRANRTTKEGYWKKTGKDRKVRARGSNLDFGTKKTSVFYKSRVRTGARTSWVMHEYRLTSTANSPNSASEELVLCKLMKNEDARVDVKNKGEAEPSSFAVLPCSGNLVDSVEPKSTGGELTRSNIDHPCFGIYEDASSTSLPNIVYVAISLSDLITC